MNRPVRLIASALMALSFQAAAQEQPAAVVVNAVELSGDGAIAGNNFNNGARLAFDQINAVGGILGRPIEVVTLDIQTKAALAKAAFAKAAELKAYAMMGPVFSDMVLATMENIRAGERPTLVGAEATAVTEQGNPYLFRTSFSQAVSMPRLARYLKDGLRVESVAMVWVDNAFGRGGQEAMTKALATEGISVVADLMTASEQRDFAEVAVKVRDSGAGVAFVYLNEREAADCLRALFDEAYGGWIVGETTIAGQTVIDMAGSAANGVRAHVGLTPDALVPGMREFGNAFLGRLPVRAGPQRAQGLYRRPRSQSSHRKGGLLRFQGRGSGDQGHQSHCGRASGRAPGREVRRQGRSRPRQLHRPGQRPPSGNDRGPACGRRRLLARPGARGAEHGRTLDERACPHSGGWSRADRLSARPSRPERTGSHPRRHRRSDGEGAGTRP